jgi:quercetin dioxygenase-like cupin family protein
MIDSPTNIADLVQYQAGSTVSHTVSKSHAGTVTAFAFDAGEALSEHTAPFDAHLQVIDGEAEITIAGIAHVVKSGQMITLPANVPHAVAAQQRFKMLLTMIRATD